MRGKLIEVGFWKDTQSIFNLEGLPDPRLLVRPGWYEDLKEPVAAYLDAGKRVEDYLGYSYCRFNCGVVGSQMGTADLSDGVYLWPEGLSHYVREHDVVLPRDFAKHIVDQLVRSSGAAEKPSTET